MTSRPAHRAVGHGSPPLSEVKLLTVAEVATAARVSKMTIYRMVQSGELDSVHVGRSYRIPEAAARRLLQGEHVAPTGGVPAETDQERPTFEETRAVLAEIQTYLATCPRCRGARQRRRDAGMQLRARQARCCAAGDTDNSCPACIAREDQYSAVCLDEIRILGGHPHSPAPTMTGT